MKKFSFLIILAFLLCCCVPANAQAFVHPGLLDTQADFDRMKAKVSAGEHPWIDSWNLLIANPHAQLSWQPRPLSAVYRGYDGVHHENYRILYNDAAAAYQTALRWKISGDSRYADKSVQILNAWGSTLTVVGGNSNAALALGIYGYELACAAEIMRGYPGWAPADVARFQSMMVTVFYAGNHAFLLQHKGPTVSHYYANWDLANLDSMIGIGVLCDRRDIYDEAVAYFKRGVGNGCIEHTVVYINPGYLGQWQESGRDQAHSTLGISEAGVLCQIAWNQGDDLFGYDNNRVLAGAEYVAKYNLMNEVPFVQYTSSLPALQTAISPIGRPSLRPCWEIIYNHYVNIKGIAAPYVTQIAAKVRPEGAEENVGANSGAYDWLGYGTLTASLDPISVGAPPSGLTATVGGQDVTLSWWGSVGAKSYIVRRAASTAGPYSTVATVPQNTFRDTATYPGAICSYKIVAVYPSGKTMVSDAVTADLTPQLVAEYKSADPSGTTVADSSGNGLNGTLLNGAVVVAGKLGNAVSLDGDNQCVRLPDNIVEGVSDFSVSAWVFLREEHKFSRIFDIGNGVISYMYLTPDAADQKVRFAITVGGPGDEQAIEGPSPLPIGVWTHVAVTELAGVGTLYLNGVPVGSKPGMLFTPGDLGQTWQNFLGKSQYPDPYLNGDIADFRLYRGALSADQVARLAANRPQQ